MTDLENNVALTAAEMEEEMMEVEDSWFYYIDSAEWESSEE